MKSEALKMGDHVEEPNSLYQGIQFKENFGYGLGDFASNLVWNAMNMFILFFYTDVIGIGAAAIGTMMLVVRLFDGASDIAIGVIVDRTKSKYGKARPWLLWMAIPFGISTVLLFTVPDASVNVQLIYIYLTYILITTVYSAINIPYGVLNALITQDQHERSILNIFRMFFSTAGILTVSVLVLPMINRFGGGQSAWILTFIIFGTLATCLFLFTFMTTKERVQAANTSQRNKDIPIKLGVKALISNKYWIIITLFLILNFMNIGISNGVVIFYARAILGNPNMVGPLALAQNIPSLIGLLLFAKPIIKKFGKRNAVLLGCITMLIGSVINLIDPTSVSVALVSAIIRGLGRVPLVASMFALLADTIEYGEWKTGLRTEGLIYSGGSFGLKVGIGLGGALVGWILAVTNYNGNLAIQADSANFAIKLMFIGLPMIFVILQMILLGFYNLDKEYPQIVKELQ